jgi:hypothetical protein
VVLGIGVGATLQAGVGAALIKRFVGQPLLLAEPVQLWRFFALGALLACCVSASVGLVVLSAAGFVSAAQAVPHWAAWWIGDTLGVLIFAPLTLTLIGHPRDEWAPRRWPVALPLLVVTLLMGLGIRQVVQLDALRQRQAFEREADSAANAVQARLLQPMRALEAMRGLMSESGAPDRDAFHRVSAPWLIDGGGLRALGWNERVARADIAAFEAREQAGGSVGFRVFDRRNAGVPSVGDGDAQVIRFIEPLRDNALALRNVQSMHRPRGHRSEASGAPVASAASTPARAAGGGAVPGGLPRPAHHRRRPRTGAARRRLCHLQPTSCARHVGKLSSSLQHYHARQRPPPQRGSPGPPGCDQLSPFTPLHVSRDRRPAMGSARVFSRRPGAQRRQRLAVRAGRPAGRGAARRCC